MTDLSRYSHERAARDAEFAEGLESGYEDFKLGVLQEEAADRPDTLVQSDDSSRLEFTSRSAIPADG
jgi:hypothetical protein